MESYSFATFVTNDPGVEVSASGVCREVACCVLRSMKESEHLKNENFCYFRQRSNLLL